MEHIKWTAQLNWLFFDAMTENGGPGVWGVFWCEGLHMLYCMGGEL